MHHILHPFHLYDCVNYTVIVIEPQYFGQFPRCLTVSLVCDYQIWKDRITHRDGYSL